MLSSYEICLEAFDFKQGKTFILVKHFWWDILLGVDKKSKIHRKFIPHVNIYCALLSLVVVAAKKERPKWIFVRIYARWAGKIWIMAQSSVGGGEKQGSILWWREINSLTEIYDVR